MRTRHLVVMAAGTGGHIFPGLAIAETMKARGWEVSWLGTERGMERDLVPKHGVPSQLTVQPRRRISAATARPGITCPPVPAARTSRCLMAGLRA